MSEKVIKNYNEKIKECKNCPGNKYPVGEYCSGCEMEDYRRKRNR